MLVGDGGASTRPTSGAASALARARARRALALAPQRYAASQFARCSAALAPLARELAMAVRCAGAGATEATPRLLKQIEQWIGLCRAGAGDRAGATRAFARATRLPGPAPDPRVFSPPLMALYRAAGSASGTARAPAPAAQARCQALRRRGRLTTREAKDLRLLAALAKEARVARLLLVTDRREALALAVYDAKRMRIVERRESLVQPGQPLLGGGAVRSRDRSSGGTAALATPWYKRWWVWAIIGVAAASAVAIPVAATRPSRFELSF